jgi:hypothetical protein
MDCHFWEMHVRYFSTWEVGKRMNEDLSMTPLPETGTFMLRLWPRIYCGLGINNYTHEGLYF